MVAAGELEVEQPDRAVVEQEHVAVVGVVVTEDGWTLGQAPQHLGRGVGTPDLREVVAHLPFVGGERPPSLVEGGPGRPTPLLGEQLEERPAGKAIGFESVEAVQLVGDAALQHRVEDVVGRQRATGVERLDPAALVVAQAAGGDALLAEKEEDPPFGVEVEDGVLLARELAVQHRRRIERVPGPDSHRERGEPLRIVEVEIGHVEPAPGGDRLLAAAQHLGPDGVPVRHRPIFTRPPPAHGEGRFRPGPRPRGDDPSGDHGRERQEQPEARHRHSGRTQHQGEAHAAGDAAPEAEDQAECHPPGEGCAGGPTETADEGAGEGDRDPDEADL